MKSISQVAKLTGVSIRTLQGELIVTTIPAKQKVQTATPIMTNLGYYIKANELQEFHEYIKNNI